VKPMKLHRKGRKPLNICREHGRAYPVGKQCPGCKREAEGARRFSEDALAYQRELAAHR
jgi:DNA-binding helix-hairpin-helix protein with protein kinase domain